MIPEELVDISRLQFAVTALYHFLFVPLTLGLSWILLIMESVYVMTGKEVYKDMTKFWGKLFGINFAMGVTTGLTLEFQFGTNWAYYSHYVGDVFGAPLAIEGMMAFMLESTFVGMFFLGWDRLNKQQHLLATFFVALGSNLSALWILIANAWMQNPVGAEFNYETMRMEMTSFVDIILNPVAQVKFIHTVAAGYVTGAMFVLSISAFYMIKKRDIGFARRSFAVAAGFGFASICSVILLGDESGYEVGDVQKTKLAVIEAEWHTEPPPAAFTVFGFPNDETMETEHAIKIPYLMGIIATRSLDTPVKGIHDIITENEVRVRNGIMAYEILQLLRNGETDDFTKQRFENVKDDLGYGLLLKKYTTDISQATEEQIKAAARDTIPPVAPLFWSFRIMVACGVVMFVIFSLSFYYCAKRQEYKHRGLLWAAMLSLPLPWIAAELGWVVAELGRQPWTISGVLPTHLSVSSVSYDTVFNSLIALVSFYTLLLIIEVYLMQKFIRLGPSSLHTGRYHYELEQQQEKAAS